MGAPDVVLPLTRPIVPGNVKKMRFYLLFLVCKVCEERVTHRVAFDAWWQETLDHANCPTARAAHVRAGGEASHRTVQIVPVT